MEGEEGRFQLPHDFDEYAEGIRYDLCLPILEEGGDVRQREVVIINIVEVE